MILSPSFSLVAFVVSAGITMSSTSTRRAPNCFNLLRQMDVLTRAGAATEATSVALDPNMLSMDFFISHIIYKGLFGFRCLGIGAITSSGQIRFQRTKDINSSVIMCVHAFSFAWHIVLRDELISTCNGIFGVIPGCF